MIMEEEFGRTMNEVDDNRTTIAHALSTTKFKFIYNRIEFLLDNGRWPPNTTSIPSPVVEEHK
jgi:hypothetical protein